jgi:hypothetical protein
MDFEFVCKAVWHICLSKKNWARYDKKSKFVFMKNTRYYCQIVTKLEFCGQIIEKYSSTKFQEKLPICIQI